MKKFLPIIVLAIFSTPSYGLDFFNDIDQLRKRDQDLSEQIKKFDNSKTRNDLADKSALDISDADRDQFKSAINNTTLVVYKMCNNEYYKAFNSLNNKMGNNMKPAMEAVREFLNNSIEFCDSLKSEQEAWASKYASGELTPAKIIVGIIEEFKNKFESFNRNNIANLTDNLRDIQNGRPPRKTKLERKREIARNDVISQALNYAAGYPEDSSGFTFFAPHSAAEGNCIYEMLIDPSDMRGSVLKNSMPTTIKINLNSANLNNVSFYSIQGKGKDIFNKSSAYLRFQSRVEGLPDIFECDSNSCNTERLKRAWALVQSKCKGVVKPF
jgi:hypothetical protein